MGLPGLIKDLWSKGVGSGSTSSVAADRDGDILERNEFLIDQLVDNAAGSLLRGIIETAQIDDMAINGLPGSIERVGDQDLAGFNSGTVSNGDFVWNTTEKVWSYDSNTGALAWCRTNINNTDIPTPVGPRGRTPASPPYDAKLSHPSASLSKHIWAFYAACGTTPASDDGSRGLGISSGDPDTANAWAAGSDTFVKIYRKSGAGWTLVVSDGASSTETSEASDTSDASFHWFALEWGEGTVTLKVDGTSKVTITDANVPIASDTPMQYCGYSCPAGDSDDTYKLSIIAFWWE